MDLLSVHDKAVLNSIFDPLHLEQDQNQQFNAEDNEEFEKFDEDIQKLVKEAILCTESQKFEEAFRLFDEALDKMPESAAILNDRAQALRLVSRDEEALADLNLAIKLTKGVGKVGVRALCQRGLLNRRLGREEEAKQDFEAAASGGSQFAKSQLVTLNPYAALCNAMLQKVFSSENSEN